MASNPPGRCCNVGSRHEGEPTGQLITIESNIQAYLATPGEDKSHKEVAVLYLPDVIGIWQNSKLMADSFAANGYTCLLLDTFHGDAVPLDKAHSGTFDFPSWFQKGSDGQHPHVPATVDPIVLAGIKTLKEMGFKKLGAVGYCFGAKYVIRNLKEGGIDCGYIAHPSSVEEDELAAISGPLSIAAAEIDPVFPMEKRHKSEEILIKTKQPYQINLFSSVTHGFAVRCDLSVQTQRFAKEQAFLQAVSWFDEYLKI
ncbi:dienelactone hydrolase [Trichoderma afarasin]